MDVILVNAIHSRRPSDLGIWAYFEKNYAYGNTNSPFPIIILLL